MTNSSDEPQIITKNKNILILSFRRLWIKKKCIHLISCKSLLILITLLGDFVFEKLLKLFIIQASMMYNSFLTRLHLIFFVYKKKAKGFIIYGIPHGTNKYLLVSVKKF